MPRLKTGEMKKNHFVDANLQTSSLRAPDSLKQSSEFFLTNAMFADKPSHAILRCAMTKMKKLVLYLVTAMQIKYAHSS
jgi:hypothetical protein